MYDKSMSVGTLWRTGNQRQNGGIVSLPQYGVVRRQDGKNFIGFVGIVVFFVFNCYLVSDLDFPQSAEIRTEGIVSMTGNGAIPNFPGHWRSGQMAGSPIRDLWMWSLLLKAD